MKVVLIITDIGGPVALHNLLSEMPANFSAPIVVMQSSEMGLLESSMEALKRTIPLKVSSLEKRTILHPGCVYFGASHCVFSPTVTESRLTVEVAMAGSKEEYIRKTIDNFAGAFRSELTVVFLSGRGREREIVAGCRLLEEAGCRLMVLSRLEAVVFNMGSQVLKTSSQADELPAEDIAAVLSSESHTRLSPQTARKGR